MTRRETWVRRTARKVPVTTGHRVASATDRSTWTTYRSACRSSAGVGLGFVLDGSGVVCIDLDHCLTGGVVAPWAQEILDRLPRTFIEVSASGHGLHIFGRGHIATGRRIRRGDGAAIEVYGDRRYIAITGMRYKSAPPVLADLSEVLADLI
ncbi:bifunctional DNA primase/polymerase [Sphaerisporangium melleum]